MRLLLLEPGMCSGYVAGLTLVILSFVTGRRLGIRPALLKATGQALLVVSAPFLTLYATLFMAWR